MVDIAQHSIAGLTYLERAAKGNVNGPVLILLHGIGSNATSFRGVLERLPPHLRVIAWNMPGYGGSDRVEKSKPQASDYAEALLRFVDALDLSQVTLLGHSLGTLVAAAFAELAPERVDRLIMAASALGYKIQPGEDMPPKVGARIQDLEAMGAPSFAKTRAPRLVFEPELNQEVVAMVETAMSQVESAGYKQAVWMLASGDLAASLGGCKLPTSFIIGVNDQITPLHQTLTAADALQKANGHPAEIARIEGAGHAVYQQKSDEFTIIVTRMLHASDQIGDRS